MAYPTLDDYSSALAPFDGGEGRIRRPKPPAPPTGLPPAPPTDPNAQSLFDAVQQIYKTALEREGSPEDINNWIQGTGGDLAKIQQGIYGSPEAQEVNKRKQSRGGPPGGAKQSLQDIYHAYRQRGAPSASSFDELLQLFRGGGHTAERFMYGQTPSLNELLLNGQKYKMTVGDIGQPNASWYDWGSEDSGGGGGGGFGGGYGGGGGGQGGIPGVGVPPYQSQFDDPSTNYLEQWIMARLNELQQPVNDPSREWLGQLLDLQTLQFLQQQEQQQQANEGLRQRQGEAQDSADKLIAFMNQRAQKLQGPAYTGTEAEILRTQALDPIENDRQAAKQRALQNIGARGMDPSSGIAQQLLNDVDAGYDRSRAGAQNELAYKTINEQRSREREAQELLGYIPQAQRAAMSGNLEFLQALDAAVNQPMLSGIQTMGQSAQLGQGVREEERSRRQEALALAALLQQLPTNAMQQSMAAIGMGPSPESMVNQAIQLYGLGQQQRQQSAGGLEMLGMSLPYLLQMFRGGGGSGMPGLPGGSRGPF